MSAQRHPRGHPLYRAEEERTQEPALRARSWRPSGRACPRSRTSSSNPSICPSSFMGGAQTPVDIKLFGKDLDVLKRWPPRHGGPDPGRPGRKRCDAYPGRSQARIPHPYRPGPGGPARPDDRPGRDRPSRRRPSARWRPATGTPTRRSTSGSVPRALPGQHRRDPNHPAVDRPQQDGLPGPDRHDRAGERPHPDHAARTSPGACPSRPMSSAGTWEASSGTSSNDWPVSKRSSLRAISSSTAALTSR